MSFIPDGALPKYILGYGIMNAISGVSCFLNPSTINTLFNRLGAVTSGPTTDLLARTFGTLNLAMGALRIYSAYHLRNPEIYTVTLTTFAIPGVIYLAEGFYWKTGMSTQGIARVGAMVVAAVWLFAEWGGW